MKLSRLPKLVDEVSWVHLATLGHVGVLESGLVTVHDIVDVGSHDKWRQSGCWNPHKDCIGEEICACKP